MSTRSGKVRISALETSPPRTRKGISPPRSPARSRKASPPARSPSRKSPGRKSPSRKTPSKFPARKSPSRTTKEVIEKIESSPAITSPVKRTSLRTATESKVEEKPSLLEGLRVRRTLRTDYSVQDITADLPYVKLEDKLNGLESSIYTTDDVITITKYSMDELAPRRSTRLRGAGDSVPEIKRSVSKSASKSAGTFSDEDCSEEEFKKDKSKSVTRKLLTPLRESIHKLSPIVGKSEFGGKFGNFNLMLLIPLSVFSILSLCHKHCTVDVMNLSILKTSWYSLVTWKLLISQVILQTTFAAFPVLGRKGVIDETGRLYCFNAFFSSVVTLVLVLSLEYFGIITRNLILEEIIPLAVGSYILAVLLAIALYVKARQLTEDNLNPYGSSGYFLNDFFMGREINPRYKKLYFKILLSRICNINALILATTIFRHGIHLTGSLNIDLDINRYKDYWSQLQVQPTILAFSTMQIIYVLNFIIKEHQIVTTFFWQHEGLGYLQIVSSALYPFYFITISKSIIDEQVNLSTYALLGSTLLFLVGFAIMSFSNTLKYNMRQNPSIIYLESMPTFLGKRLLVSTLWGLVRHPNYTGDILMHIALSVPGLSSGRWVAAVPALLTVVVLLHRAWRDHVRCQRRYGAAWQRYCKRVPSVLIPKVL